MMKNMIRWWEVILLFNGRSEGILAGTEGILARTDGILAGTEGILARTEEILVRTEEILVRTEEILADVTLKFLNGIMKPITL